MTPDSGPNVGETHDDPISTDRGADSPGKPNTSLRNEPWRTPYAAGAIRTPGLVLPPAPPRRGPVDWLLIAGPLAAALVSVTVVTVAYGGAWGLYGTIITAAFVAGWSKMLARVRRDDRGSESRSAGAAILVFSALLSPAIVFRYGLTSTALGLFAFGAGALAWRSVSRIRAADRRAETDRANGAAAYRLAVEWNQIREALCAAGAHVERSLGAPCLDEPLRVRTIDPGTGEEAVRDLDAPLPRGGWVVISGSGSAICTAAPGALEAWLGIWPDAGAPN